VGASFLKCGKHPRETDHRAVSEVNLGRSCERHLRSVVLERARYRATSRAIVQRLGSRFPKTRLPPMRPAGLMLNRIAGEDCPQGRLHKTCRKAPCKRVWDRNDPSRQREIALARKLPAAGVPKTLSLPAGSHRQKPETDRRRRRRRRGGGGGGEESEKV